MSCPSAENVAMIVMGFFSSSRDRNRMGGCPGDGNGFGDLSQ